jgi:hypothetical protein
MLDVYLVLDLYEINFRIIKLAIEIKYGNFFFKNLFLFYQ